MSFEIPLDVFRAAPIGMVVLSHDGSIQWTNDVMRSLIGDVEAGEVLDDVVERWSEGGGRASLSSTEDEPHASREERWRLRDGTERRVTIHVADVAANGSGSDMILQVVDVTEARAAREALQEAEAELRRRNLDLERSNRQLTEFAYVASHDLSEPLRVISGHVELLAMRYGDELDDDARKWIEFAVDGCARQRTLIDDLLAYSRAGRVIEPEEVDLGEVVERVTADLSVAIAEAEASVRFGDLPTVIADRKGLGALFQNLIGNAIKFRREGVPPVVEIGAERRDDGWLISVADNGIGIDEKYRDRIFGVFQRLHGRGEYGGTGIGLAIARKSIEAMGGEIWVEESASGGSVFLMTLPDPPASAAWTYSDTTEAAGE